ncbi:Hsp20/alpha crystallin family protein [Comamonadaceae bacterium G21597-S1]|nr:Hsp20/alpha crystallin family protein [Comamonadaceae bacterium G21597-S1]
MYESLLNFPGGLFADFDRVRRDMDALLFQGDTPRGIRAVTGDNFPNLNIGHTAHSVDVFAFAPGIDPGKTEVTLDRGLLTVSGERPADRPDATDASANVYGQERFSGRFRRTVSLPEDIDPDKVNARYRDGVLHISIGRRESLQPKRIAIA